MIIATFAHWLHSLSPRQQFVCIKWCASSGGALSSMSQVSKGSKMWTPFMEVINDCNDIIIERERE